MYSSCVSFSQQFYQGVHIPVVTLGGKTKKKYAYHIYEGGDESDNMWQTLTAELARIQQCQYCAGKIVSGALQYTNMDKLNRESGWESTNIHVDCLGLSLSSI